MIGGKLNFRNSTGSNFRILTSAVATKGRIILSPFV